MMKTKPAANQPSDREFCGLDELAARWSVSRGTARRILENAGVAVFFLTGAPRGVRRYRLADIQVVEEKSRSQ